MALINCPECGKGISDKADICIHCGFPLKQIISNNMRVCLIDGIPYDLKMVQDLYTAYSQENTQLTENKESELIALLRKEIRRITGMGDIAGTTLAIRIINAGTIPHSFDASAHPDPQSKYSMPIRCPKCGSTSITTGARGVNFKLGLIGASKTVNRCQKCGYAWDPKTGKKV